MHVRTHTSTCTHACMHTQTHTHTHTPHIHACTYTHTSTCTCTHTNTTTHTYMHIYTHTHKHLHMHTHTHTLFNITNLIANERERELCVCVCTYTYVCEGIYMCARAPMFVIEGIFTGKEDSAQWGVRRRGSGQVLTSQIDPSLHNATPVHRSEGPHSPPHHCGLNAAALLSRLKQHFRKCPVDFSTLPLIQWVVNKTPLPVQGTK